jgi:aldose 1-epimerase
MIRKFSILVGLAMLVLSCGKKSQPAGQEALATDSIQSVTSKPYGKMKDGSEVLLYTLKNKNGVEVSILNYGAIIQSIKTPDKKGIFEDVTLGYDSFPDYESKNQFFGAVAGRYGNRIANAKFVLDGKTYPLVANNGVNHLHGGLKGFDKANWKVAVVSQAENPAIQLTYLSKDGEEGYPGNLNVEIVYTLTEDNQVSVRYMAKTDKRTVINLTQHTYFNLTGDTKRDILSHELEIAADRFLPVDKTLIPTGELKSVSDTPFDFTKPTVIGSRIKDDYAQLKIGGGYDHCWVFTDTSRTLKKAATVYEPTSGRVMETYTTEPGVQFYTGNFLKDKPLGKKGIGYKPQWGFCLETQHFPDSPNHPSFPSVVLNPGGTYKTETVYKFSTR